MLLLGEDVLILSHQHPDGDTLGSAFGLCFALQKCGKRARIECSDPIADRYDYLTDHYTEESFVPQMIVAVDIADTQLFGEKLWPYRDQVDLCIDHHPSNTHYARRVLLEADSAATAEVIYEVIKAMGVEFDPVMASAVYTGIATDTGCFRYTNVTARTHRIAADLYEKGAMAGMINRVMFETKSLSRIRMEQLVLSTMEYHFDNRCALIVVTLDAIEQTGITDSELDGISAIPRQIEGVQAGITLREKEGGYKISLRTSDNISATAVCSALGGGGHARAAGCFIAGNLEEAKGAILEALRPELEGK
ncbi:DHH family phosphoesterase [Oscillospiraceae bacterium NSJ-54]|uniref:DHH family phosphoesterase n=2 Tax=Zongyangia hominis TaxID=2763677 RepID=A0A926EDJ2_9FIRM|nr:DHH family phosphoesterase [Zongyangia hominis]